MASGGRCPQCEQEFKSLSGHWARSSTCSHPDIEGDMETLVQAVLLAGGRLVSPANEGEPFLTYSDTDRRVTDWLASKFGYLYSSTHEVEQSDGTYHRMRTMHHPGLNRFREIAELNDGDRNIPATIEMTPDLARIWYALGGRLYHKVTPAAPVIRRSRLTASDTRIESLFNRYAPNLYEHEIRLRNGRQWFEYIGWDAPADCFESLWMQTDAFESPEVAECPECHGLYSSIGTHWMGDEGCTPDYPEYVRETVTALLLAGGSKQTEDVRGGILFFSTDKALFEWVADTCGPFIQPPRLVDEGGETTFPSRGGGVKAGEMDDGYELLVRAHPELEQFNQFFTENGVRWPADTEITSRVLAVAFARYGTVGQYNRPALGLGRNQNTEEEIERLFAQFNPALVNRLYLKDRDAVWEAVRDVDVPPAESLWKDMKTAAEQYTG